MDKATLVDVDIAAGKQVLQILDQARFRVSVALWLYSSEFEAWRLYLASPLVDTEGPKKGYLRLFSALNSSDPDLGSKVTITLVSPKDPFIRPLRRMFGRAIEVNEGTRLGGHAMDGMFVEQAYLYRIR